eukprot:12452510-Ditylum_brightwellii.AAC.2
MRCPGEEPLILHSKEGVTQGHPLSMILYGIVLVPLATIIWMQEKDVMAPFYTDDTLLNGPATANARMMLVLMEHGPDFGYFLEPEKSIHVCNRPEEMEEAKACIQAAGLRLHYVNGHRPRSRRADGSN